MEHLGQVVSTTAHLTVRTLCVEKPIYGKLTKLYRVFRIFFEKNGF